MVAGDGDCDLAHSHTWYANLAGHLSKLLHGVPHVVTSHSLEPQRPWKAEQLGGGYRLSSWAERTAYEAADAVIAVSHASRTDVLSCYPVLAPQRVHVIHNGVDTEFYRPVPDTDACRRLGIDLERPIVVFVGRITRQKGVPHLLRAALDFDADAQLVLLASAADTPELAAETGAAIEELHARRSGVIWVAEMQPRTDVREILSRATVFVCPSIYEPLGIVNLEAMACETAVVASDVGGIPEVVVDGDTGLLVHYDEREPGPFEAGLSAAVNRVLRDRELAATMGRAGRARAIDEFGWATVAARTVAVYESVLAAR
jgi:starch synthase